MTVRVEYIDKLTGEKIPEKEVVEGTEDILEKDSTEIITGHEGDTYKTEEKKFDKYEIVKEMYPTNAEGTMTRVISEDGTVSAEIVVKYYYTKKATVIERHVDIKTGEIIETEVQEGEENDPYKTEKKELEGYDIVEEKLPVNAEGEMKGETIVVYYYIRKANVVVEYIDKATGEKLKDIVPETSAKKDSTEKIEGHEGDKYETVEKTFKNYKLKETSNNTKGEMKVITKPDGTVEITTYVKYYYVTEAKVKEEHIDIETGELLEDVPKTPTENKPSIPTQITNIYNNIVNNNNPSTTTPTQTVEQKTPLTGDIVPVATLGIIILTIILNVLYSIRKAFAIGKKKFIK